MAPIRGSPWPEAAARARLPSFDDRELYSIAISSSLISIRQHLMCGLGRRAGRPLCHLTLFARTFSIIVRVDDSHLLPPIKHAHPDRAHTHIVPRAQRTRAVLPPRGTGRGRTRVSRKRCAPEESLWSIPVTPEPGIVERRRSGLRFTFHMLGVTLQRCYATPNRDTFRTYSLGSPPVLH